MSISLQSQRGYSLTLEQVDPKLGGGESNRDVRVKCKGKKEAAKKRDEI